MSLYRLSLALPAGYAQHVEAVFGAGSYAAILRDVEGRLARMGAGTLLFEPMQDPTAPDHWTAVARAVPTQGDDVIRVLTVEPLVEPTRPASADHPAAVRLGAQLDPGLSPSELVAVSRALERETNPRHLAGFASTFEPHFPVAASHLRARSILVQGAHGRGVRAEDAPAFGAEHVAQMRFGAVARADNLGIPRDLALGEVKRACCTYVSEGMPLRSPLPDLPPEISGLAAACVRPGARGTRLVDRGMLIAASPPTGDEGYVSPSALQLALASTKPGMSRVWNQDGALEVHQSLQEPAPTREGRIAQMRAKLALEKAHKTIERGRWIRWYERNA